MNVDTGEIADYKDAYQRNRKARRVDFHRIPQHLCDDIDVEMKNGQVTILSWKSPLGKWAKTKACRKRRHNNKIAKQSRKKNR